MQLSMQISYSGGHQQSAQQLVELEAAGLDIAWIAEALQLRRAELHGLPRRQDHPGADRRGDPAALLPHADADRDDRGRASTRSPTVAACSASAPRARRSSRAGTACRTTSRSAAPARSSTSAGRCGGARVRSCTTGRSTTCRCRRIRARVSARRSRSSTTRCAAEIPIYVASLGEKNVALTAEIADGWLPIFFVPEKAREVFGPALDAGFAKRDPALGPLDIAAGGLVAIGEESEVGHVRDLAAPDDRALRRRDGRQGQELLQPAGAAVRLRAGGRWRSRTCTSRARRRRPRRSIPDELLELTTLVGPEGYVKERLAAYKEAGVTVLNMTPIGADPAEIVGKIKAWSE